MPAIPTPAQMHVDAALTNVSIRYPTAPFALGNLTSVPVMKKSDKFFIFDKKSWRTRRADKANNDGVVPRVSYALSTDSYTCETYGVETPVTQDQRDNADSVLSPDATAAEFVTEGVLLEREYVISTAITGQTWTAGSALAISAGDEWDRWKVGGGTGGAPIASIETVIDQVCDSISVDPEELTVITDRKTIRALRFHPDFLAKISGGASRDVPAIFMKQLLSEFFGPAPQNWHIVNVRGTSDPEGTSSPTYANPFAGKMFIGYIAPSASINRPSALYTFRWRERAVDRYYEPQPRRDVIRCLESYVTKVTAADAGQLITNTISST